MIEKQCDPRRAFRQRMQATSFEAFRLINDLRITSVWVVIVNFETSGGVERTQYKFKIRSVRISVRSLTDGKERTTKTKTCGPR